jgi:dipeptidyl aminopeptidase/acylaminoacyl peptidase
LADPRVQAAITHWAGRFVANGIDYNDFVRTTGAISRWDEWLDAWSATAEGHVALAESALAAGHRRSAGEAYLRAAISFHFSKFVWVLDPLRNRANTEAAVRSLYAAHQLLDPSAERVEAPLDGASVVANLRLPAGAGPAPLAVLIPGLDSTKEEFFHWESVFLDRGMATLSLDGPGQGETGFALNIRPDYDVAVAAILDAVADRPRLDQDRIGAVGVSLGGHYVIRAAAFEPRLKAVAGISGCYDFAAEWDSMPELTRETVAHHTGAGDESQARRLAHELDLDGVAERVRQPCLVITGQLDRVIPWEETKRIADAVPGCEWLLYPDGTHVCNNIPFKYRPLVSDWMRDQLTEGELS